MALDFALAVDCWEMDCFGVGLQVECLEQNLKTEEETVGIFLGKIGCMFVRVSPKNPQIPPSFDTRG